MKKKDDLSPSEVRKLNKLDALNLTVKKTVEQKVSKDLDRVIEQAEKELKEEGDG